MTKIGKAAFDAPEGMDVGQALADILEEEIEKNGAQYWADIVATEEEKNEI